MLTTETAHNDANLTVICGADVQKLKKTAGFSVEHIRMRMQEVLNITKDHSICLLNGKVVEGDLSKVVLRGDEEIEFKKPSGQKGS